MTFDYYKVPIEDAKRELDGHRDVELMRPSWDAMRRQLKRERLLPQTLKWMALLPQKLRPFNLGRQYPRIANEICRQWNIPARRESYLKELLIVDGPRKRQGFPQQVATEIAALALYQAEL